ncbi:phenylalanine--tRNA ligase subunit alpha [Candidatus Peregrinibacteria bacterium CG10_big_fil_rev_8_21_14_0_10_49_24]|nr:MAG: phenylalanine--tRNA ligase subunit alpha [Candidatus Peregrinibacteria bacterium CG11_big_fil_rev_8_21_14_0_20_49_14]PIR51438.1 MAG: phenylalanine--tRNA ligase subunit alpha [Candidatus Peregrinibacteria bacterium CG10_big_fil_rev_8_21_14_0_10_49_24]PJA67374.1 MAG: phenylalanine--tRNA ligase subunit alpha [Candidatus Peregrinibacteria bacterium CG_4_9_14_3_um_filter_49_12]
MPNDSHSWANFISQIQSANNTAELDSIEHAVFGRKNGAMTLAMQALKNLKDEKRKSQAKELNTQKVTISTALEERRSELVRPSEDVLVTQDALDVTLNLPHTKSGHLHLVHEFIAQVEEVFGRMGFDVHYGPEIETEDLNFTQLNIPEDHPARDTQDTFWIKEKGKEKHVLRTHTSPVQIRYMRSHTPPFSAIFPGKVYRKDADATHSPMFHQFEGLMIGKDISVANLKAVLITGLRELIGRDVEFRFRTGFFPFTEPSLEMDMMWQGDLEDSREGKWLEMGGCGMVHPNVLRNCNIDPEQWQGFAFGFGIERPLMIKHQIPDLRAFFQGDLRFLEQF